MQLQLNYNEQTNQLTAEKYDDKTTLSKGAQQLLDATLDPSITINVNVTDGFIASDNKIFVAGAFGGNKVLSEKINGKAKVEALQDVNPNVLGAADREANTPGEYALHEATEAYEGAKIAQNKGKSAPSGSGPIYQKAHERASKQPFNIAEFAYDGNGNSTVLGSSDHSKSIFKLALPTGYSNPILELNKQ